MCQVISANSERRGLSAEAFKADLEDRPAFSKVQCGSRSFVRREDQIMQNNLIRIPRKAFRRASQDRTTLNLPINERQTLLAIGCMLSRWSEASLMRC
jgi:hypothetical protein